MTITRLGHIAFTVEDLDRSAAFACDTIGLRETARTADTVYLTSNDRHHQLRLTRGDRHECLAVSLDVDTLDAWTALRDRVADAGFEPVEIDDPYVAREFRFAVPNGPVLGVCHGAQGGETERYSALGGARPRKLGHVTCATPDPRGVDRVLTEVLGLRLSDRLPLGDHADGELAWYRCNTDHHGIGVTPGDPGVHHYAWELAGFADFGEAGDHLLTVDKRFIWGPGRHGPGENHFAYYTDLDGSMIELYSDMQQIVDEDSYRRPVWPDVESSANIWGPPPPAEWFAFSTPFAAPVAARSAAR